MRRQPPSAAEHDPSLCRSRRALIVAAALAPFVAPSTTPAASSGARADRNALAAVRLFDRHLESVGGDAAWRRVRSLSALGTLHDREGNLQAHQLSTRIVPAQWRLVWRQAAQLTTLAGAGTRGARSVLTAVAAQALALDGRELAAYDEDAPPASLALLRHVYPDRREPVRGIDGETPVWKVVTRSRAGRTVELAFEADTGLVRTRRWIGDDGERLERYADYRMAAGEPVRLPMRIETWIDGRLHATLRQSRVTVNVVAPDDIEASLESVFEEIKRLDRAPPQARAAAYEAVAAIDWRRFVEQPGTSWAREAAAVVDRFVPPSVPAVPVPPEMPAVQDAPR